MTRSVSDDEVEAALTEWARESLAATTAEQFSVAEAQSQTPIPHHVGRRLWAALATAALLLVVAVGLAVRYVGHEQTPPSTATRQCPRQPPFVASKPRTAEQPLFARPVAEMTACSYSYSYTRTPRLLAAVPLGHHLSEQLARHFNHAATRNNDPLDCLTVPSFSLLLARDSHGEPLTPVSLIFGCRQISATNGTTTRSLDLTDLAFQRANRYVSSHR